MHPPPAVWLGLKPRKGAPQQDPAKGLERGPPPHGWTGCPGTCSPEKGRQALPFGVFCHRTSQQQQMPRSSGIAGKQEESEMPHLHHEKHLTLKALCSPHLLGVSSLKPPITAFRKITTTGHPNGREKRTERRSPVNGRCLGGTQAGQDTARRATGPPQTQWKTPVSSPNSLQMQSVTCRACCDLRSYS